MPPKKVVIEVDGVLVVDKDGTTLGPGSVEVDADVAKDLVGRGLARESVPKSKAEPAP
jgi:hypothetical protein